MQNKVILIILDGVGVGELPDAHLYNDCGSNTLANLAEHVENLNLPNLQKLGLGNIIPIKFCPPAQIPLASFGKMGSMSKGKDSITGHWELMGLITQKEFPTFPSGFPDELMEKFLNVTGSKGYLGNIASSGTVIIQNLGEEHQRTSYPIIYTSADSVFQIAAHEDTIALKELYIMCELTRKYVCIDQYALARVIARPFTGKPGTYKRTTNRKDYSVEPHSRILLDILMENDIPTIGIGKVDDLYAGRGLSFRIHTKSNSSGIESILKQSRLLDYGLIIANLVDFDQLFGHRNDISGFARCLEEFDQALPRIMETLKEGDWLILTADHGNDPVTTSTDHSREYVPLLMYSRNKTGVNIGTRESFADLGKTIGEMFGLNSALKSLDGNSFYRHVIKNDI